MDGAFASDPPLQLGRLSQHYFALLALFIQGELLHFLFAELSGLMDDRVIIGSPLHFMKSLVLAELL